MVVFVNTAERSNSQCLIAFFDGDNAARTEVKDVFGAPTTIIKVPEVDWSLVVTAVEQGQERSFELSLEVVVKIAH